MDCALNEYYLEQVYCQYGLICKDSPSINSIIESVFTHWHFIK